MERTRKLLQAALVGGGIIAALAFGSQEALASSRNAALDCGPGAIGTCTSNQDCQNQCDVAFPGSTGECRLGGCCWCFF